MFEKCRADVDNLSSPSPFFPHAVNSTITVFSFLVGGRGCHYYFWIKEEGRGLGILVTIRRYQRHSSEPDRTAEGCKLYIALYTASVDLYSATTGLHQSEVLLLGEVDPEKISLSLSSERMWGGLCLKP